jgi:hypothetical protein
MQKTSGEESIDKWKSWANSMTDQDFVLMTTSSGKLNRRTIAEGCGFSKSVLGSNGTIKKYLNDLENELRQRAILPQLTKKGEEESSGQNKINKESLNTSRKESRVPYLEQRILELEAENNAIKGRLGRFSEIIDVYSDLGEL